ncbi:hypothetical protein AC1031_005203 [Aphanomyces cochlioides]|nr:hypothetical protein AC1031_005203 [Aphanomyces cochlioides]
MGDTSLVLRHAFDAGGGIVSSDFNFRDHELVVVRRSSLHLYKIHDDDTCQLRFKLPASDKEQFLHVQYAEWINAFVVFRQLGAGLHRALLQADGSSLDDLGTLSQDGASLLAVVKHSQLHEFVTADSTGGIRLWALRYSTAIASRHPSPTKQSATAALRCPTRLYIQDAKGTQWHALAMDSMHQRVIGASTRGVKLFDALSGHVLAKFQSHPIRSMAYLPWRDSILIFPSASGASTQEWNVADLDAIHRRIHDDGDQPAAAIFDQLDGHTVAMSTSVHAFATKLGIDGVVATTKSSQLVVWSAHGQVLLPLRSVASDAPPSFESSFVFCDFQCAARNWIYVVQTNDKSCRVSIVELLSRNSTARMLTSSSKLLSLRDVPFNTPPRGVAARRGYMLFGGTTSVKSIQLFEDVALPVCDLALTRHEGTSLSMRSESRSILCVGVAHDVPVICFLDYSTLLAKCIVGWSDGVLDLFQLTGQRWRMLKRPSGVLADCVCTLQVAHGIALVAGDASGSLDSWRVQEHAASDYLGAIQAHAESIVSIQNPSEMCFATISLDGQIKLWTFAQHGGGWTLAGFFHTLSSNLSVAKLVDASHICCGTESGAVELWKLPAARQATTTTTLLTAKKPLLYQPHAHRLAVTDIAVYQNVGASIDHDFTLVATMARDQTIVFWYFGDVLVPFRVVVASVAPCGGFFSTAASSYVAFLSS